MPRNLLYFLPIVLFAGFAAVAYWGMQRGDGNELPSAMVGRVAPPIQITPLPGQRPFVAADFMGGQKFTFVNFWASWCAPCRAEHPNLVKLADAGVPVYGVNYRDAPDQARAFLDELGNPYALGGADPNARMALDWGVYGIPETFVIGADGRVITRVAGPLTQRAIETRVKPALAAAGYDWP